MPPGAEGVVRQGGMLCTACTCVMSVSISLSVSVSFSQFRSVSVGICRFLSDSVSICRFWSVSVSHLSVVYQVVSPFLSLVSYTVSRLVIVTLLSCHISALCMKVGSSLVHLVLVFIIPLSTEFRLFCPLNFAMFPTIHQHSILIDNSINLAPTLHPWSQFAEFYRDPLNFIIIYLFN